MRTALRALSNFYIGPAIFPATRLAYEKGRANGGDQSEKVSAERADSGSGMTEIAMYDALMLAIGCGFFVAAVLYTLACEKM